MKTLSLQITELIAEGYNLAQARAKVAHDALLLALHKAGMRKSSTIKGGVVMSEITRDIRRTTMDLDFDVIRYSISDLSLKKLIARLAKYSGLRIEIFGTIQELRQDDYRGKRMFLKLNDGSLKAAVSTKVDIGVHTLKDIRQMECRFSALKESPGAFLFANAREQIFVEKLMSLLRHGAASTRGKDVFDMYYLMPKLNKKVLKTLVRKLIYESKRCRARCSSDIIAFITDTFSMKRFQRLLTAKKSNWLQLQPTDVTSELLRFLKSNLP